ncbi:MAG: hypothetical protein ACREIP_02325 [Alphaproteobacteria bacterium]
MIPRKNDKRRRPVFYAIAAALIGVATAVGLEAAGSMLAGSYSGLDGKLSTPSSASAPVSSPTR